MRDDTSASSARDLRNRIRRKVEARAYASRDVVEAARPFAKAATPAELAKLSEQDLARLKEALAALDAVE